MNFLFRILGDLEGKLELVTISCLVMEILDVEG